jgi:alkylation response protein AidB-like acyl-CoA dehydrogenase
VRMPVETAQEIWADPRAVISNGPPMPPACAIPMHGGYRVTGRWNFSSGIHHANWVAALAPVGRAGEDGPQGPESKREVVLLIPKDQVELLDVWQVNGLRGTGSFSFQANDLFVPVARSYGVDDTPSESGPLYLIPKVLMFATGFGTVALGVARTALDAAIDIAGEKIPAKRTSILRDTSTTQRQIGEAEALWGSARAFLRDAASALWESACRNGALTTEERMRLRLAGTHAIREAARVVAVAYDVAGSGGIFKKNPIQRRLQDAQVITQQVQGRMTHYDTAGAFYLGLEPKSTYF